MPFLRPQNDAGIMFPPAPVRQQQAQDNDMGMFNIPTDETPGQAALRKRRAVAQALSGPAPMTIGAGLAAIGDGLELRQQRQNAMFPSAPGGAQPDFITAMQNLFSGGNNGGLY
ncbi:hypothetical protein [Rhizobium sp. Rhizsp82]|uniref:hypothetical protein n=1 Tax=Rhizobium sp. Rhizsp82 TaxID=3243057 RepID=UPI0039B56067